MSKFFQALENAEKERAAEARSAQREPAPEPVTTTVLDPPAPAAERSAPLLASSDAATAVAPEPPVVPAYRATPPLVDGANGEATISSTAPSRVPSAGGVTSTPGGVTSTPGGVRSTPGSTRSTAGGVRSTPGGSTYGAPTTRRHRRGRGAHADAFVHDLAPGNGEDAGVLDDHLVSLLAPTGFAAEQYRTVRLAIETHRRERGLHVVAISSPGRREGKTVTAINIAGALAQSPDARVVLVDADLRHPSLASYLGLPSAQGLSAYLLDTSLTPDDIVVKPASTSFSVVVAGPPSSMPYELLKSSRLTALFQDLRARFDYVVVDTPPVLLFPDVGIVRDTVDGFVMVVRANHTPREGVNDGLDTIGRHRVVGLIFNDDARHVAATSDVEPDHRWRRYLPLRLGGALVD
jgi:capsular exopolysaccharide synthesis family protein